MGDAIARHLRAAEERRQAWLSGEKVEPARPTPPPRETRMGVIGYDVYSDQARAKRDAERVDSLRHLADGLFARVENAEARGGAAATRDCALPTVLLLAQSRDDFGRVLENVVEKAALAEYRAAELPYQKLAAPADFKSFRPHSFVRRGDFELAPTGEMAEIRHGVLEDGGGEDVEVHSRGTILSLSRKCVVNDDLGALRELIAAAVAAVTAAKQSAFSTILRANPVLSDATEFFHGTRQNLLTGAALSDVTLGLSLAALRKQRSPAGATLNLPGRFLVVGPSLEMKARQLVREATVEGGTRLAVVVDAEITDGRHYVFADPARRPGFVAGDLGGQPLEILARWAFDADAYQFRVLTDFGVGAVDPRAAVLTPSA